MVTYSEDSMLSPLLGKFLQACWFYFPVVHSIKPSIAFYLTALILILDRKKKKKKDKIKCLDLPVSADHHFSRILSSKLRAGLQRRV